ncbi:MAG TPA: indolepyruvate ferredoxin oxidoreductase subunit alpha, partial [Clostridia bacterium]|nr:indolepyruvate ferredoxin oxidoreductase subunit alpha [Clostridia bacterium]
MSEKQLMLGNEAVARGAWEAGAAVVASYPGTPSTEITEYCAKYPDLNVEWAVNEKVALEIAFGAAIGGARALSCCKHVGLNVAADPLFTAAYTGVRGGLVIVVADDPGMHSSQNEQDSRYYALSAHIPMLVPSDAQECKDFTKLAFELSEQYDTPVLLGTCTRIAHARSPVALEDRAQQAVKPWAKDPQKYVMMPAMARGRHVTVEAKLAEAANDLPIHRVEWADRSLGIVCAGTAYQYVKEALPDASVLKLGMVHPLPEDLIRSFADGVERLLVIEEMEPFLEDRLRAMGIACEGKTLTATLA